MHNKRFTATATLGLCVALLSGCGVTPSVASNQTASAHNIPTASNQTTNIHNIPVASNQTASAHNIPAASNQTASAHNIPAASNQPIVFPPLVKQGMQQVVGHTSVALYAPASYPGMAHTPFRISVEGQAQLKPVPSYQLIFSRNHQTISTFSVTDWGTAKKAASNVKPSDFTSNSSLVSKVNLGYGITADVMKSNTSPTNRSLVWSEQNWHFEVRFPAAFQNIALIEGKRIVVWCQSFTLPKPGSSAWSVTIVKKDNTPYSLPFAYAYAGWDQGTLTFQVYSWGASAVSNLSGGYLDALLMANGTGKY